MRRKGARGNTTASRVKTLVLHVEARHGRADADHLLATLELEREYLDDECRPLSRELWHRALEAFASRYGSREIVHVTPSVIHPENLGVWARVLRGAGSIEALYRQLDQAGGEEVLMERFLTVESTPTSWRGAVATSPESELEKDGLLCLARAAELRAVPLLFGFPPARVEVAPDTKEGMIDLYASWQADASPRWLVGTGLGVVPAGSAAIELSLGPPLALAAAGGGAMLGALAAVLVAFEQRRRATQAQQMRRIEVLERASALRDARDRQAHVFREGSVVAGQYRLGRRLGSGAIGTIWQAVRASDGELVAIKLLKAAVAHDAVVSDRLRREAAALGLAWHPNVVEILDEGQLPDGTSFIVMEHLEGETLEARLARAKTLAWDALWPIALQLCDALAAVHAAGVVHRDLKPSNVFLVRGAPEVVKIVDFGVARVEWAEPRLTLAGTQLGTPGYMSPEQESGQEIDGRSDLYSLGALLFRCLTGQAPGESVFEALEPGSDDSGVRKLLPDELVQLLRKACAPSVAQRYPTARAMRDALEALGGTPRSESSSRGAGAPRRA